jgi:hypothetical protein
MKFETLYQELKNSTETIRTLLAGISQEEARVKPTPETWSLLEVTCHLYDEECEDFREHLDFILHRQNETWHTIRPTEWVVERKYNEQNFEEMRGKFFLERKVWHHDCGRYVRILDRARQFAHPPTGGGATVTHRSDHHALRHRLRRRLVIHAHPGDHLR